MYDERTNETSYPKALVELDGKPFKYLEAHRDEYAIGGDNN